MNNIELSNKINELWTKTKAGELPRSERFEAIERLTEEYIEITGKRPDSQYLDRLATLCLHEELTDATPYKVRNTEYPIHSDRQREEIEKNEAMFVHVEAKKNERQTRRKRSDYENTVVDRKAMNAERKQKYREFTKVQPVVRWNIVTGEIY
jgi:hypothetical protein